MNINPLKTVLNDQASNPGLANPNIAIPTISCKSGTASNENAPAPFTDYISWNPLPSSTWKKAPPVASEEDDFDRRSDN
jgi:hypothetical protein